MEINQILREHKEKFIMAGFAVPFVIVFNLINLEKEAIMGIQWKWIMIGIAGLGSYVFNKFYQNKVRPPKRPPHPKLQEKIVEKPVPQPTKPKRNILDEFEEIRRGKR